MQRLRALLIIGATLLPFGVARAQQNLQPKQLPTHARSTTSRQEPDDLSLQKDRLNFERQKALSDAEIENKKLAIESEKLRLDNSASKWAGVSSAGPLIVALGTLVFSILSFRTQGRQQANLQLDAAKLQFDIKAAEIAFAGQSPTAVANRAKALKAIFPSRLPSDFTTGFSPSEFGGKESPEGKKLFMELLLKYPGKEAQVVDLWARVFPGDTWLDRVKDLPESQNAGKETVVSPANTLPPSGSQETKSQTKN
jgi:hypothetical protein